MFGVQTLDTTQENEGALLKYAMILGSLCDVKFTSLSILYKCYVSLSKVTQAHLKIAPTVS